MLKKVWFQLHWLFGITAGLVLAVVGLTGALLSFEDEIVSLLNRGNIVPPPAAVRLAPDALAARVAGPGKRIAFIMLPADIDRPARIAFAGPGGKRGETLYLNPYSGERMATPTGADAMRLIRELHRFLLAGPTGKSIVGASTLALLFLCLSGLYLRWPRLMRQWRSWLAFKPALKGRAFLWNLHATAGTWVLVCYLLSALTGLFWSYDWYRDAVNSLAGVSRDRAGDGPPRGERGDRRASPRFDLQARWPAIAAEVGSYQSMILRLPSKPGQPLQVSYQRAGAAHERAFDVLKFDPASGALLSRENYADKPAGAQLVASVLPLHTGAYFGLPGRLILMLSSLAMPLFAITGWMLYLDRRRKKKQVAAAARLAGTPAATTGDAILVCHASQSGQATELAWQTAASLQAAGRTVCVEALGRLPPDAIGRYRDVLFIVSTFGDGEAPDSARAFRKQMALPAALDGVRFALLALGDRQYDDFCAFGRQLQDWLIRSGASARFAPIEVDAGDPAALAQWQAALASHYGAGPVAEAEPAATDWRIVSRQHLNPGSLGGATYHLELAPPADQRPHWTSGDLVEVTPRHAQEVVDAWLAAAGLDAGLTVAVEGESRPLGEYLADVVLPDPASVKDRPLAGWLSGLTPLRPREYSITSLPEDGHVHLLVRQVQTTTGAGTGSGWLTRHAPLGGKVSVRVRRNAGFHLPSTERPLILIGNGTGLASLLGHLRARARQGQGRNWLIFGERNADRDFYYRDELEHWREQGLLERLDAVFSRDPSPGRYVQDVLRTTADTLREWLDAGAAVYVCGSLKGMAPAVDTALRELVGEQALDEMMAEGRYCRDVY